MKLADADMGREYSIVNVETDDDELRGFLMTLGCYSGEPVTVVSKIRNGYVISVSDGRYNIDRNLAEVISIADR